MTILLLLFIFILREKVLRVNAYTNEIGGFFHCIVLGGWLEREMDTFRFRTQSIAIVLCCLAHVAFVALLTSKLVEKHELPEVIVATILQKSEGVLVPLGIGDM